MSRRFTVRAFGLLLFCGAILFLFYSSHRNNSDFVPSEFRGAIDDREVINAAKNWNRPVLTATNVAAPAIFDTNRPVRLALGSLGSSDDLQNGQLADLVLANLTGAAQFDLVERQSLEKVMREWNLSAAGLVRARDAVRVGKVLNVDWFLLGTKARINGTNVAVVRIVDARSGILLAASFFASDEPISDEARKIAGFVKRSWQEAAGARSHVYLAIGAFEDLSLNNRQADLPAQLRGYLTTVYRGSSVTLLEREYVEILLQEVHLDLAGLTDESSPAAPRALQSAYWLVSGQYQSYETTNYQVEVSLDVHRVFGKSWHATLRGSPDTIGRQAKQVIDDRLQQESGPLFFTRRSEARLEMEIARELLNGDNEWKGFGPQAHFMVRVNLRADWHLAGLAKIRRQSNLQQAMQALKTVLILEPTNYDAKLFLADCMQAPLIGQISEARELYRDVLEDGVTGNMESDAKTGLDLTFDGLGPWGAAPWYAAAAKKTETPIKSYFRQKAEAAEAAITPHYRPRPVPLNETSDLSVVKSNLLVDLQRPDYAPGGAIGIFASAFGTNQAVAGKTLIQILPELGKRFPGLTTRLVGAVLCVQVETNNPMVAPFEQTWKQCVASASQGPRDWNFFEEAHHDVLPWLMQHGHFELAEEMVEYFQKGLASTEGNDDRLDLGLEYYRHGKWEKALTCFQCYSNRPIVFLAAHWSCGQRVDDETILVRHYVANCERELGHRYLPDPREFAVGDPAIRLEPGTAFLADSTGVWLAGQARLRHVNADLQTDWQMVLPVRSTVQLSCLCLDKDAIWLGTCGAGLLRVQKSTRQCTQWTVSDGLLMNSILQLQRGDACMWIGYGERNTGGLGKYDIASRRFTSFTPSFGEGVGRENLLSDRHNGPPRRPILDLAIQSSGDVLAYVSEIGLQHYCVASNSWDWVPSPSGFGICAMAGNPSYFAHGLNLPDGGLEVCALPNGKWNLLTNSDAIPFAPCAMALHGSSLWVGGTAYLARVDVPTLKARQYGYMPGTVNRVQAGGRFIWVECDGQLYRVPGNDLE